MKARKNSRELFESSQIFMPGGVNSPVRSFNSVGGIPRFVSGGDGSRIFDVDGNTYIDYLLSWGPLILGHSNEKIVEALKIQIELGTSYGAPTELELELAELVCAAVPSVELVRMVNSGTEACMSALRLARAFTGRDNILKFEGSYHGHADSLLVSAGSGANMLAETSSAGVTVGAANNTLVVPYNDLDAVYDLFRSVGDSIACVIVEPVAGNMGLILPEPKYLEGLRHITEEYGALLIFDEVLTGFRVAYGGAQARYGITPDLTCFGKVIGGGMPVGAYGGRRQIMEMVAPLGPVYQAGTLSGNPIAMAAGVSTLSILNNPTIYLNLEARTKQLTDGLRQSADEREIPLQVVNTGSIWGFFFSDRPVNNYSVARNCNGDRFNIFFHSMLDSGIYLPPSPMESSFVSTAHTSEDVEFTINASRLAFQALA